MSSPDWRKPFEVFGSWTIGGSDSTFGGVLRWDPNEGARLHLSGGGIRDHGAVWDSPHEIICGYVDGEVFNVLSPFSTTCGISPTGAVEATFVSNVVLVGREPLESHDPEIVSFTLDLDDLGRYLSSVKATEQRAAGMHTWSTRTPKTFLVGNEEPIAGMKLSFWGALNRGPSDESGRPSRLPIGLAHLLYSVPRPLSAVRERVATDLLSLLTNRPALPSSFQVYVDRGERSGVDDDFRYIVLERTRVGRKRPNEYAPTVSLSSFEELNSVMAGWLAQYGELHPFTDLRVSGLFEPAQFAETRFLGATQALEGLHRRFFPERDGDPETLQFREGALDAVADDPALSDWLATRLKFVHEPSMARRLKDMISVLELHGMEVSSTDRKALVRRVVELRNELTHRAVGAESGWTAWELMFLSDLLDVVVDVCLFEKLGASVEALAEAAEGISVRAVLERSIRSDEESG